MRLIKFSVAIALLAASVGSTGLAAAPCKDAKGKFTKW